MTSLLIPGAGGRHSSCSRSPAKSPGDRLAWGGEESPGRSRFLNSEGRAVATLGQREKAGVGVHAGELCGVNPRWGW